MTSDPRFRPNVEDRVGLTTVAAGLDMLIMARQMAVEISERAAGLEVDPIISRPDSKSVHHVVGHDLVERGLPSSTEDATDLVAHEADTHTDQAVGLRAPLVTVANPSIHTDFDGHGSLSLSAPAALSSLLNAIAELPAQWTMGSGAPTNLSYHNGTHVALNDASATMPADYRFSGAAANGHMPPAMSTPVSGLQNLSPSASAVSTSTGQDDADAKNNPLRHDPGHVTLSNIMRPVSQIMQTFVPADTVKDGTHFLTVPNLVDGDLTRSLGLPDASAASPPSSSTSSLSPSAITIQDSVTQLFSDISNFSDTLSAVSDSHAGSSISPTFSITSSLSFSAITPRSPNANSLMSTPVAFSVVNSLSHNSSEADASLTLTIAPSPAISNQAFLTLSPTHLATSSPALPNPAIQVPVDTTAAVTPDPAHVLASTPALPDPAALAGPAAILPADPAAAAAPDPTQALMSAPALLDPAALSNPVALPADPAVADPTYSTASTPALSDVNTHGLDLSPVFTGSTPSVPAASTPSTLLDTIGIPTPSMTPSALVGVGIDSGPSLALQLTVSANLSMSTTTAATTDHAGWKADSVQATSLPSSFGPSADNPQQSHSANGQHPVEQAVTPDSLHNQSQQASSMPHPTDGNHTNDRLASQATTTLNVAQAGLNIALDAPTAKHPISIYNEAEHAAAEAPKQVIHLASPGNPGEQANQTTPELRHESAITGSSLSHNIVGTSSSGSIEPERSLQAWATNSAEQTELRDQEPTKLHFTQAQDRFADHQLSPTFQGREGQGASAGLIDVAYSTTSDIPYGPSGAGISPQVASYLLSFLDRLDTHAHLYQTAPSAHEALDIGHMVNHHDDLTSPANHSFPNTEPSHVQDTDLYHTGSPGHVMHIEPIPFHSFDHHG